MAVARKPLPPGAVLPGGFLHDVDQALEAIIIRCKDGSPRTNWIPVIMRLARDGRDALRAAAGVNGERKSGECECSVCGAPFDLDGEGGVAGEFGILPVAFCPWCYASAMDMLGQVYREPIDGVVKVARELAGRLPAATRRDPAVLALLEELAGLEAELGKEGEPVGAKGEPNPWGCWNCGETPAPACGFGEWFDTPTGRDFRCNLAALAGVVLPGDMFCDSCPLALCETCRALPEFTCPVCGGGGPCAACGGTGACFPSKKSETSR